MYNFSSLLNSEEEILWTGKPNFSGKRKSIAGEIFLILFTVVVQIIMICSVIFKVGDGADGFSFSFIVIFLAFSFFGILGVYSILNKLLLEKKLCSDDEYCITNKRIMIYKGKKDEVWYGYIINYHIIEVEEVEKGCGDLILSVMHLDDDEGMRKIINNVKHFDTTNLMNIHLISVDNVYEVRKLVSKQRQLLINSNEMPTISNIKI